MRYLVRVFSFGNEDDDRITRGIEAGHLRNVERMAGFTQGTADEKGILALGGLGLDSMSIEPVPKTPSAPSPLGRMVRSVATMALSPLGFERFGAEPSSAPFQLEREDGERNYLLGRITGSLTPLRTRRMADAGVQIVEKQTSNTYVLKAESAATLKALEFIGDIRTYGVKETTASLVLSVVPAALKGFEAVVHADVDAGVVARSIADLGGQVLSHDARTVRFSPGYLDLNVIADLPGVATLIESAQPRLLNDAARTIVGLDRREADAAVTNLDGRGQIVGVADTGIDDAHPDLADRILGVEALGRVGDHSDPNGHGTHVAATIAGSGVASGGLLRGAAPGATIYFQSLLDANGRLGGLPSNIGDLFATAYAAGARVHNNSWGAFLEARYGSNAVQVDRFVHEHPDFLPVIAAGNSGRCHDGPEELRNSAPGYVEFPSIATPASAKNGLTVGASRSDRTTGGYSRMTWKAMWEVEFPDDPIASETISGNAQAIAAFSGRGPVDNDMVKPDLVAPGTDVASAKSSKAPLRNFWGAYPNNPAYAFMGGTSMAAPLVAGSAALVRQHYVEREGHAPSAALVKATLINGTAWLTHTDALATPEGEPNYHQGFGRLDMGRTLPRADADSFRLRFVDTLADPGRNFTETGQRRLWRLKTDADGELRFCLTWTDFPASGLQNSLLLLIDEVGTSRKWSSNQGIWQAVKLPTALSRILVVSRDPRNNVQTVRVPDAVAGEYLVSVVASNILFTPQSFALVATGALETLDGL